MSLPSKLQPGVTFRFNITAPPLVEWPFTELGCHMQTSRTGRFPEMVLAILFIALCTGVNSPARAQAQVSRTVIDTPIGNYSDIPNLVRAGPVKTTPETMAAVQKRAGQRGVARARSVDIDFSVLQTVFDDLAIAGTPRVIRIPFFEDAALLAEITNVMPTSSGGLAFTGRVPGILYSSVVLVNNNGVVSMNVGILSRQYTIHGLAESGYVASELMNLNLPDHTSPPILINAPPLPKPLFQTASDALTAADTGAEIDVMVVYTPVVRANNGGTAQMNTNIDAQIANTNLIYAKSNVVQRLRLVYKGEVAYTEVDINTDLSRLQNPSDGFLDAVPMLRDIYKADFVSLWGNYPTTCGLGYLMTTESSGFETNAYNAVNSPPCTDGTSATFAHELGHNMGLQHDNFVTMSTPNTTVTPEGSTIATTIAYAHGYVDTVNRFRTVMAYDDQCIATSPNTSCDRIPNFSNPNVLYNTFTSGNLANAHARQALNDTRETTANFRAGLPASAFTGPGIVVFFPASYSVGDSAGSVQLTIQRHVGSAGAISVSYATANGTATAGRSFTTTSGTLTWVAGDITARTITVPILSDVLKGREFFTVVLTNPVGGVSIGALNGTTATATVTITSDKPDTFPVGGVIPPGYVTPATSMAAWTVDLTDGYQSPNSLKSAAVLGPNADYSVYANSDLEYSSNFATGNVTFAYRVSSLGTQFAILEFMIDGVVAFSSAGGDTGWLINSSPITAGTHTVRWRFKNSVNFPCASATAPTPPPNCADRAWIDSVVLPLVLVNSTTTLASSRNPSSVGQSVTLTATVAGGSGTPTGNVAFSDGGTVIFGCAAVAMSGGSAQCATTALLRGARAITAQYSGSPVYSASTSTMFTQTVGGFPLAAIFDFLFD